MMNGIKLKMYLKSGQHNYYGLRFIGHDKSMEVVILFSELERQFILLPEELIEELSQIRRLEDVSLRMKEIIYKKDYADMAVDYISQLIKDNTDK